MVSTESPKLRQEEIKIRFFTSIALMGREKRRECGVEGQGSCLPWKGGEKIGENLAGSAASPREQGGVSHASRGFK